MEDRIREKTEQLRAWQKKLRAYDHAMALLNYDSVTHMPTGGAARVEATLEQLSGALYDLQTDPALGELLADLGETPAELDLQTRREVEELARTREKLLRVPREAVMEQEAAASRATQCWQTAKKNNDFAAFAPHLEELIRLKRRYAACVKPDGDVYDTLLDEYEPGTRQGDLDAFFRALKEGLTPLIEAVAEARQPDQTCLTGPFDIARQRQLSAYVMELLGLDAGRCALSESAHPFTTRFSRDDVRITTRYREDDLAGSLYSTVHEGGHAMYELGVDASLRDSVLGEGASTAVHESQSRLWENNIGRSLPFCRLLLPKLKTLFPAQFSEVSDETFYRAVNAAAPSLIRTEADELTYSMHILVRYEIEKAIFAGSLSVRDLPEAWASLYRKYLGVEVPDDANGVLQDIHWAGGDFGYFPGYALGSAYAAQIFDVLSGSVDVARCCAAGDLTPVRAWLTEQVYRFGMLYRPQELLRRVCGGPFDPDHYIDRLWKKYGALYDVRR